MSEVRAVFKHSKVYAVASLLNRGAAFFLIPVYTNFLAREEYGILAVITVASEIVGAALGLRLGAAMSRVYFDYAGQDDRNTTPGEAATRCEAAQTAGRRRRQGYTPGGAASQSSRLSHRAPSPR